MTNIEHQPKPNTPDEKPQTVDDILGPEYSRKGSLGRVRITRLSKEESLVQFPVPMPKEEADELNEVVFIADTSISYLARVALQRIVKALQDTSDWDYRKQAYLNKIEPFLIPLSEPQKDSASPAELSD